MRGLVVSLVLLSLCVPLTARADDIYAYEKNGKVWFSNYCPKDARNCKRVMKSWTKKKSARAAPDRKSTASRPARTRKGRKWRPPRTAKLGAHERGKRPTEIGDIVKKAAGAYDIPEAFIHAVITVESSYKVRALSHKGAMGLMQLMPGTAADMGVTKPYDAYQNVMGGTRFLRILANRFDGDIPKVLAAYHAGGASVARAGGIPYRGSDGYVRKVLENYYRLKPEFAGR